MRLLSISLAGALGTGARYLLGNWAAVRFDLGFPAGTIIVNLTGCFLIAAVMQLASVNHWSPESRVVVTAGFLGGFTTYSAFNFEAMQLMQQAPARALLYAGMTLVGGLAAGWLGLVVARQFAG